MCTEGKVNRKHTIGKTFLGLMCLVLFMFAGCNEFGSTLRDEIPDDLAVDTVNTRLVTANTNFGFNLFNEIRKAEQNQNIFISPFSVSVALAITLNGASGETEQAMTHTLQLQGLGPESINTGYAQLRQALQAPNPKGTLTIANSLWARQGVLFKQDFLQRNTQFFGAEISTLDFNDPSASKTINQWVDTNTNGKIKKIVDDKIDPLTVLFLINAIYFKGTWQTEFDSSHTRDGTFHLATGGEKQVPMMARLGGYPYYENYEENFQAISLPYGDGKISMYIFLPARGSDFNTFLEHLNAENWENWMSQFHEQRVSVVIPKFKLEYEKTLNNPLQALGMEIAFGGRADFSRMSPLGISPGLYIREVVHKTVVEVNEEGTEAAAATSVGIRATSASPAFIVDRPFFFAIRDNNTKTVLFMGIVVNPPVE